MTPEEQLEAVKPWQEALHAAMVEGLNQGRHGWRDENWLALVRRTGRKFGDFCRTPTIQNAAKLAVYAFMTVEAMQHQQKK